MCQLSDLKKIQRDLYKQAFSILHREQYIQGLEKLLGPGTGYDAMEAWKNLKDAWLSWRALWAMANDLQESKQDYTAELVHLDDLKDKYEKRRKECTRAIFAMDRIMFRDQFTQAQLDSFEEIIG